jgi:hypothetical protein
MFVSGSKFVGPDFNVRFEVFRAVSMKNAVFWDVTPCASCMRNLLVTDNVVLNSLIISTLTMETIPFSQTSVLTRATQRHISDDGILHLDFMFHLTST